MPLPWPSAMGPPLSPTLQQPQLSWQWGEGSLQALYSYCCLCFCWMIPFFVSPVLSQLHQHPSCAHLSFMAGTCRQVQVSRLLAKLSIGKGEKWLKKCSQALMAVIMHDYLFPLFRPVLFTGLSEQQQLLAVGVLPTQRSQSWERWTLANRTSGTRGRKNGAVT